MRELFFGLSAVPQQFSLPVLPIVSSALPRPVSVSVSQQHLPLCWQLCLLPLDLQRLHIFNFLLELRPRLLSLHSKFADPLPAELSFGDLHSDGGFKPVQQQLRAVVRDLLFSLQNLLPERG